MAYGVYNDAMHRNTSDFDAFASVVAGFRQPRTNIPTGSMVIIEPTLFLIANDYSYAPPARAEGCRQERLVAHIYWIASLRSQ